MSRRPRTADHAPTNSGSTSRPERVNIRCTTEECGRLYNAVRIGRQFRTASDPAFKDAPAAEVIHRVIVPVFEKVVRAYLCGSKAERNLASVYLQEFIAPDDYLSKRRQFTQQAFDF